MSKLLMKGLTVGISLALILALFPGGYAAAAPHLDAAAAVPGEVVVAFNPGTAADEVGMTARAANMTVKQYDADTGLALLSLPDAADKAAVNAAAAGVLSANPNVVAAEPNYIFALGPITVGVEPRRPATVRVTDKDINTQKLHSANVPVPSLDEIDQMNATVAEAANSPDFAALGALDPDAPQVLSTSYNNDPGWQWGWYDTYMDITWKVPTNGAPVAVIDTGVDNTHPDLTGGVTQLKDFVNNDAISADDFGHGTHVAGIIGARVNNGKGIEGISKGGATTIYSIKVLDQTGSGTDFEVAQGILLAANTAAVKVINMSLGGAGDPAYVPVVMRNAVKTAIEKGKLVVMAAGNAGVELDCTTPSTNTFYPACFFRGADPNPTVPGSVPAITYRDRTIVVAAAGEDVNGDGMIEYTDLSGTGVGPWVDELACRASYTNYGSNTDIIAPGTDIYSTLPSVPTNGNVLGSNYGTLSGTSMASPHVAGAAALVWGKFTAYKAEQVKNALLAWSRSHDYAEPNCNHNWAQVGQTTTPYLWLPGPMQVFSVRGTIWDSVTGAGIPKMLVNVQKQAATPVNLGTDTTCTSGVWCDYFRVHSLPYTNGMNINLQFNEAGHTVGYQTYLSYSIPGPGSWWLLNSYVPQKASRYHFVVTWDDPSDYELDSYLFLPSGTTSGLPNNKTNPHIDYIAPGPPLYDWIDPSGGGDGVYNYTGDTGELVPYTAPLVSPQAKSMMDSWRAQYTTGYPFAADTIGVEKNTLTLKPAFAGNYTFVVATYSGDLYPTDFGAIPPDGLIDTIGQSAQYQPICAFVWDTGVKKQALCLNTGDLTDPLWVVGRLNGGVYTPINAMTDEWNLYLYTGLIDGFSSGAANAAGPVPPK